MPKYTTGAEIVKKNNAAKKKKFDEILAKAKGDQYRYDPKTKTSKRIERC